MQGEKLTSSQVPLKNDAIPVFLRIPSLLQADINMGLDDQKLLLDVPQPLVGHQFVDLTVCLALCLSVCPLVCRFGWDVVEWVRGLFGDCGFDVGVDGSSITTCGAEDEGTSHFHKKVRISGALVISSGISLRCSSIFTGCFLALSGVFSSSSTSKSSTEARAQ